MEGTGVRHSGTYLARLAAKRSRLIGRRHGVHFQEGAHRAKEALVPQEPRRHGALCFQHKDADNHCCANIPFVPVKIHLL